MMMRFVLVALVLCFGVPIASCSVPPPDKATSGFEAPLRTVRVIIDGDARKEFLTSLSRYANKNALEFRVSQSDPSGQSLLIQMSRKDVKIIGVNPFQPNEFHIHFYGSGDNPASQAQIDALALSIVSELSTVKNISVPG